MINMILEHIERNDRTATITGYTVYYTHGNQKYFETNNIATLPKNIREWIAKHIDFIVKGYSANIYMHDKVSVSDCDALRAANRRYKARVKYWQKKRLLSKGGE